MKERYRGIVEFVKVLQARLRALSAEADEIERAKYEGEPQDEDFEEYDEWLETINADNPAYGQGMYYGVHHS